jgi:phage tail protein X
MSSTAAETVLRTTLFALLTGVATITLAGYPGIAGAQTPQTHIMAVGLPDGEAVQVRYMGDVPPAVVLAPTQ